LNMPKGKLLIIGGAEDKGPIRNPPIIKQKNKNYVDYDILGRMVYHAIDTGKRIEVVTTASQQPQQTSRAYIRSFRKAGFADVGHIDIENKEELKLREKESIERVKAAGVVFFSGGDQYRLTSILAGSAFLKAVLARYEEDPDFMLAGTSAGAMVMSEYMIYHAENNEAMLKGHVKYTTGFSLLKNCVVDTHFVKRGRYGRLFQAVLINPSSYGIGLGEDTGMLIEAGKTGTCLGSGMVIIVDSTKVRQCNLSEIGDDEAISVENLKVHALTRGDEFDFETHQVKLKSGKMVG
jgi:cyanophycinase